MRYSHKKRFEFITNYISKVQPENLLDYGCGDGTFLIFNNDNIKNKFGFDVSELQLSENTERFKEFSDYSFLSRDEINKREKTFDVITCMEVMEHCTPEAIESILEDFSKLLKEDGELIISVPIETGAGLVVKQTVRYALGAMKYGNYEYTEYYTNIDFLKALFANKDTNIDRKFFDVEFPGGKYSTCTHYAFNWMALRETISKKFQVQSTMFTPINALGGFLNSQAWFFCKKT